GSHDDMLGVAGRNIVCQVDPTPLTETRTYVLWEPHDDGLASYRMVLTPGEASSPPDASESGGQYLVVTQGSLEGESGAAPGRALVWVDADEPAPELTAGADGCEIIVLQFPRDGTTNEPAY